MRISLIAAALVALPLLTACGGNDKADAKPNVTQEELAKYFKSTNLPVDLADCAAKIYYTQGISQDGLRLMVSSDAKSAAVDPDAAAKNGMSADDQAKVGAATSRIMTECVNKAK
ncbi:hypothetical protein LTV02_32920 [Nocardia yamanashiensis]|uniref:hypothetical protein n=1 Tax=Nocardia yamanashiensis TaxID=209247 RepID=UPI001E3AF470|nr:hypothetical protein [Nocardia yamanashiensis]UGT40745.1 hypothetical protein LTV02_32920 [Nocardia yamanashiensis]